MWCCWSEMMVYANTHRKEGRRTWTITFHFFSCCKIVLFLLQSTRIVYIKHYHCRRVPCFFNTKMNYSFGTIVQKRLFGIISFRIKYKEPCLLSSRAQNLIGLNEIETARKKCQMLDLMRHFFFWAVCSVRICDKVFRSIADKMWWPRVFFQAHRHTSQDAILRRPDVRHILALISSFSLRLT